MKIKERLIGAFAPFDPAEYERRVRAHERMGATRSDAQATVDAEGPGAGDPDGPGPRGMDYHAQHSEG